MAAKIDKPLPEVGIEEGLKIMRKMIQEMPREAYIYGKETTAQHGGIGVLAKDIEFMDDKQIELAAHIIRRQKQELGDKA